MIKYFLPLCSGLIFGGLGETISSTEPLKFIFVMSGIVAGAWLSIMLLAIFENQKDIINRLNKMSEKRDF